MVDAEAKAKSRRFRSCFLVVFSLGMTLVAAFWLRRVEAMFAEIGITDILPIAVLFGLKVSSFVYPVGWIAMVLLSSPLVFAIHRGLLDRCLIGINVLSMIWAVIMVVSAVSGTLSVINLQRALAE